VLLNWRLWINHIPDISLPVNLGKWVLRYLFSNLVDEMIKRDELYRKELNENIKQVAEHPIAPTSIQIPPTPAGGWQDSVDSTTPRANGNSIPATPGMGIGVATPAVPSHLPGVPEDEAAMGKRGSQTSRTSADKTGDYF
jgi:WD repeat-containing protein 48